jgi:thiamine phosphate synthase YjbQ (UPF0047 family)
MKLSKPLQDNRILETLDETCNCFRMQFSMLERGVRASWQNIFFCEFDGPRKDRRVVVTVISDR